VQFPASFLYPIVKTEIDESLDVLIDRQNDDGAWHLTWRLGSGEVFDRLQILFEMHITNLNLTTLERFGRIER